MKRPASAVSRSTSAEPAAASEADIEWDTTTMTPERSWFHARKNISAIDRFVKEVAPTIRDRSLACIDCFGASAKIKQCFEAHGEEAANYDIKVGRKKNDSTCATGFYELLRAGLSLKPSGLVMGGPPCSMFIFLSSSVHKRTARRRF